MKQVTALLLNWKRPENIVKTIASIRAQSVPVEIWLWNNNPDDKTAYDVDMQINSPRNFFCWPRWLLGSMAETEYIFTLDDDLMFADKFVVEECIQSMNETGDEIYGIEGVLLDPAFNNNYFKSRHFKTNDSFDALVDIVKGRFMFMRKEHLNNVTMENEPTCEDIKISSYCEGVPIVPAFLHNRLTNLAEGDEALFAQPWQKQRRQDAVEKYFK